MNNSSHFNYLFLKNDHVDPPSEMTELPEGMADDTDGEPQQRVPDYLNTCADISMYVYIYMHICVYEHMSVSVYFSAYHISPSLTYDFFLKDAHAFELRSFTTVYRQRRAYVSCRRRSLQPRSFVKVR